MEFKARAVKGGWILDLIGRDTTKEVIVTKHDELLAAAVEFISFELEKAKTDVYV